MNNSVKNHNTFNIKSLNGLQGKIPKKKAQEKERKRLLKYLYFLKDNHDWDYNFIIELLQFKIKMVRKCVIKNGYTEKECLDEISAQMQEVECLLEKVVKDEYFSELEKEFEIKYACKIKRKYKFKKDNRLVSKLLFKGINDDLADEADAEYNQLHKRAFDMKKAGLKNAFGLITENIWGWWN